MSHTLIIDAQPADNGARKNQEAWIQRYNELGKVMLSASDLYYFGKNGSDENLAIIRTVLESSLVSSTRISCSNNDLSKKITWGFNNAATILK